MTDAPNQRAWERVFPPEQLAALSEADGGSLDEQWDAIQRPLMKAKNLIDGGQGGDELLDEVLEAAATAMCYYQGAIDAAATQSAEIDALQRLLAPMEKRQRAIFDSLERDGHLDAFRFYFDVDEYGNTTLTYGRGDYDTYADYYYRRVQEIASHGGPIHVLGYVPVSETPYRRAIVVAYR